MTRFQSILCFLLLLSGAPSRAQNSNPSPDPPQGEPTAPHTGTAQARFGLKFDPVKFDPPHVDRFELPNGVGVYFYAEPSLPLATVLVRVGVGSVNDPPGKVGAAEMTGQVIRNGGTAELPGDQLDRELEARGAELSVNTDREETVFTLSVLKEDLAWGVGLLTQLLREPLLPADKLEEARGPRVVEIQQKLDVPMQVGRDLFPQLAQGRGNPWGWVATEKTLRALRVDDLKAVYAQYYKSGNMLAGVSGGIGLEQARGALNASLGSLPRVAFTPPTPAEPEPIASTHVYLVPRDVTQNVVYFGHGGISRHDPRKWAVRVFNNVLSGGFTSRLFQEVRSNRGLAYSVGGRIGEGTRRGIFFNVALTKAPSSLEALEVMLGINRDLQKTPPLPEEMDVAVQSDVNAFVFFFDRGEKIVQQQITLEAYGYPKDYLQNYVGNLTAIKPQDVATAARSLIDTQKVVVLVVGKVGPELKAALEKMGPVTEIPDAELRADWL